MNTLELQLTGVQKTDLPALKTIFKKFNIKSKIIKEEKDDTLMTKEEFYQMIDKARKEKTTRMTTEEIKAKYLK